MAVAREAHVRSELALFLRTKRTRVDPAAYGVVASSRRRTAGLRREEVAELAGVGPTWYTWLEQGRNIRPSLRVLRNVASVLQLSKHETSHLLRLAGHEEQLDPGPPPAEPAPFLQIVVDQIACPAWIRTQRYDVVMWNAAADATFGFGSAEAELERNFLWRLFRADWPQLAFPDVTPLARYCLANFRRAYAGRGMTPGFASLVARLRSASPLFDRWWAEYPVEASDEVCVRAVHDTAGELELRFMRFDVAGASDLSLVLAAPAIEKANEVRFADLAAAP